MEMKQIVGDGLWVCVQKSDLWDFGENRMSRLVGPRQRRSREMGQEDPRASHLGT